MQKTFYCDSSLKESCVFVDRFGLPIRSATWPYVWGNVLLKPYNEKVTVNQGEYQAVLTAIELAQRLLVDDLEIKTDSLLVVNQVNGDWKCRLPHLQSLRDKIRSRAKSFNSFKISWISREENPAGKILEKR